MNKEKLPLFKIDINNPKYVSVNRLWSFDWASTIIATGGRGIGKTTGLVGKSVDRWDKYGQEFVLVKRYKKEVLKCADILVPIVNNSTCKNIAEGTLEYRVNGQRCGYAVSLSLQQDYKSNGIDFSRVGCMIFDEALLKPHSTKRYLIDEVAGYYLELVSTIFRNRSGYKVFILGNNADIYNPYYAYFNVPLFEGSYKDKRRGLYCEYLPNSPVLEKEQKDTPLAKLTQGTRYYDYNFDNKLLVKNDIKIGPKLPSAVLIFRIVWNDFTLNVYRNDIDTLYVELRDKPIQDNMTFALMQNNQPNYPVIKMYRGTQLKRLMDICYYAGDIFYDNRRTGAMLDLIQETLK